MKNSACILYWRNVQYRCRDPFIFHNARPSLQFGCGSLQFTMADNLISRNSDGSAA